MRASQLLNIWEHAAPQPPVERALTLLAAAQPEMRRDDLAALSIGERDARLLDLREEVFGNMLEFFTPCPKCGERLELNVWADELREGMSASRTSEGSGSPPEIEGEDFHVSFRLPNSLDFEAASVAENSAQAREILIERCVLEATCGGQAVSPRELPREAVERLGAEISRRDPAAEINLNLRCPSCGYGWALLFDIASFLWEEWNSLAKRLLREVATLAFSFGWHEREILAMSPTRRQIYLELAR